MPRLYAAVLTATCWSAALTADPIDEATFLAAADGDHPAVRALAEPVELAAAEAIAARAHAAPEIETVREAVAADAEELELSLSWQLPGSGRRARIAAATERERAAAAGLAHARAERRQDLRGLYARWALASEQAGVLQALAGRLDALAERESRRARAGESSGLDARRLALGAADARARLALTRSQAEMARAAVAAIWPGMPPGATPVLPVLPAAVDMPVGEAPALRAREAEHEAAKLAERAARRSIERPTLVAGWKREEDGATARDGPVLGLAWSLPVGGDRRAERAAARARTAAAAARLTAARQALDAERGGALAAYRRLAAAARDVAHARGDVAPMVRAATAAFELGELDLTDLLEIIRAAADAELNVLALHQAALAAHRAWARLAGTTQGDSAEGDSP